jgi:hypothetical protein
MEKLNTPGGLSETRPVVAGMPLWKGTEELRRQHMNERHYYVMAQRPKQSKRITPIFAILKARALS